MWFKATECLPYMSDASENPEKKYKSINPFHGKLLCQAYNLAGNALDSVNASYPY